MSKKAMDWKVWMKLQRLGLPPHMRGTEYIYHSVLKWEPGRYLTKDIYPEVAKMTGSSWIAVEKSVRYALDYAWDHKRGFTTDIVELFGLPGLYARPCAAEFVAALGAWRANNED